MSSVVQSFSPTVPVEKLPVEKFSFRRVVKKKKKNMFSKHDDGGVDMINGERRPAIHLLHGSSLSSCQLSLSLSPPLDPPTPPSSPATRQEVAVINAFDVPPSPIVMEFFFFFLKVREKKPATTPKKTSFSLVLELDSLQQKKKEKKKSDGRGR